MKKDWGAQTYFALRGIVVAYCILGCTTTNRQPPGRKPAGMTLIKQHTVEEQQWI